MADTLTAELKRIGQAHGLDGVGVTTAAPFPAAAVEIQRRKADGTAGRLRFTLGDPRSTDIIRSFPAARSLVVAAQAYVPDVGSPPGNVPGKGTIARFAVGDRYLPLRVGLDAIADRLRDEGFDADVVVDDNRLIDRAAAVRAGLAWWGKSTMAIAPKFGPWLLFGSVITDAELEIDTPMQRDCGTCTACIPACPTGALNDIGRLDATKCIAYWLQTPGVIPFEIRQPIGSRIYGCDECLVACPPGQRLNSAGEPNEAAVIDVVFLLTADGQSILDRFGHFYIPRRNPDYLRRNALVVAANVGGQGLVEVAASYVTHRLSDVRAHAVAAAHALGADFGNEPLLTARRAESHPDVLSEYARIGLNPPTSA